jgi:hypothetical protein
MGKPYQLVIDFEKLSEILLKHYNEESPNNPLTEIEVKGIIDCQTFKMLDVRVTPKDNGN